MKRIIGLLLCLCFFCGTYCLSAVCAEENLPVAEIICDGTAVAGEKLTVTVSLSDADSYCGVSFGLIYDSDKLSVCSAEAGQNFSGNVNVNPEKDSDQVYFSFASATPVSCGGEMLRVVFDVADTASGTAEFSLIDLKMKDEYIDDIAVSELDAAAEIQPKPLPRAEIIASSASAGQKMSVSVKLSDVREYCGISFGLIYDTDKLSIASAEAVEPFAGFVQINTEKAENQVYFSYSSASLVSLEGEILTLVFDVADSASGTAEFSFVDLKMKDDELNNTEIEYEGTSVQITPLPAAKITLSCQSRVIAGEEFTVTVSLSDPGNYCGMSFGIVYDNERFTVVSAQPSGAFAGLGQINQEKKENQVYFNYAVNLPRNNSGDVMTVVFRANENVSGDAEFYVESPKMYDVLCKTLPCEGVSARVTVSAEADIVYGDADDNGEVNVSDVIRMLQAIASGSVGKMTERQRTAADVTGDRNIDVSDVIKILQYLASPTTPLGPR